MTEFNDSASLEGRMPDRPVRWGLRDAVIGLVFSVLVIGSQYLLVLVPWIRGNEIVGVGIQILFYALILGFVLVVSKTRGLGRLRLDFGFELRWIDLLIGIGLALVLQVANVIYYDIAIGIGLPKVDTSNLALPHNRALAVFDGLAVSAFFAPIVEELFFRGLVMRAIRNAVIRFSRLSGGRAIVRASRISVVVSAIVFAAAHLYEARNPTMLFVLGLWVLTFGLIAAWVDTRTKRLGPSLIMHMLINGAGVVLLLTGSN